MGPRKKPSSSSSSKKPSSSPSSKSKKPSSSKKPNLNQQAQPSKFGIQYFFERQTQNAVLNSQKPRSPDLPSNPNKEVSTFHDHKNAAPDPNYPTLPHRNPGNALKSQANEQINAVRNIRSALRLQRKSSPSEDSAVINPRSAPNSQTAGTSNTNSTLQKSTNALDTGLVALNNANPEPQNPNNASNSPATDPNNPSQVTPPSDIPAFAADAAVVELESSPEIPKSVSLKRFKFSPGMLIKQSQDEGGDEVTWKISPVNQRLKVVSKSMPGMVRMLADASRLNSLSFRHCSKNKMSLDSEGKLEKWLSSPTLKATERSMTLANKVGLKRVNPDQHMDLNGNGTDMNASSRVSQQSPFRTPPSLSYCNDKPTNGEACNGASQQLGFRQHKKALLELLDQVEDVISVEESVPIDKNSCSFNIQDTSVEMDPNNTASKGPSLVSQEKVNRASSSPTFLVLEVSQKHRYDAKRFKVLRLLNEQSGEERAVYLWDQWFNSVVAPGDTIHVTGDFDDQGKCDVDQDNNLLIIHPDILLSGTRIAGSSSCLRRTVLDERLKCSEHSTPALLGTLLHQIFQAGLVREIPTKTFLEEYARIVLQKNVQSLYACGVNENVIYKTLIEAVPKILNWIALFRDSQDLKAPTVDFKSNGGLKKVKISEVMDIEEMAWAPKYGLKGMIDASVLVKVVSDTKEPNEKIMPLEFKTGKATSGQSNMEHCAQVILYTLLMSERYLKPIDAGLLYYLYTDQTQGIVVRRLDLITLIMRRNELANDIRKASRTQQLPPMLQNSSICKGCRHLNVCTIYHKAHGGSTDSSGLGNIFDSHIRHLTNGHCVFLRHWDHLIDLEYKEMQAPKKDIGPHSLKSDHSSSIFSVILDTSDRFPVPKTLKENQFIYHFVRQNLLHLNVKAQNRDCSTVAPSPTNDFDCTLRSGDYVTLSSESSNITVASGVITNITHNHVSVSFNKRLRLPWTQSSLKAQDLLREVWRIDKDEFSTSFAVMRFNLVQLFLESEQSSHLRAMIVDLEVPRFDSGCIVSQDPAIFYVWSQKNLNNDQRRAILKILTAKDYALILGMPGTGKTSTMVHAVKALLIRGTTVLLTSYTNSAVDNLLIKLKFEGIDFVRIGRPEAVHEEVRGNCISAMDLHSVDDIKLRLDQVQVVAVTCLGITNPLLANKKFDVCIMDEAGQTTLPVSLGPLMRASMFVLVGDHYQLPPLVQSAEARENGMGVSLFCRLSEAHPQAVSALQSQYRMCQGIMELSNALIYGDRLHCGSTEISNAKLKFSSFKSISPWLKKVLDPIRPVIFINTDGLPASEARDNKTVNNLVEASIIGEVTNGLLNNGIQGEDIGIITPYNSQANLVRKSVQITSVEINTIDKYQGRDKDCILVSFVRSSENPKNCNSSLLGDWHRINVAITRPKKKLIMVGSCKTLSRVPLLKLLIEKVDDQLGLMNVSDKDINYKGKMKRCSKLDTSVFQD